MNNQKIFSDLAELAGGAMGVLSSMRQQIRDEAKQRLDELTERMDLVTRDDVVRLEGMIAKLRARVEQLEGKKPQSPAPAKTRKPAAKKTKKSPPKKPRAK